MSAWEAIFLSFIQGLTEFLPVSSSGHLVIFQQLLGIDTGGLLFDTMLHVGTLVAVLIAFWPDIRSILKKPNQRLTWMVIIGAIPTALMGVLFQDFFEGLFESLLTVGIALLLTGLVLWYAEVSAQKRHSLEQMKWPSAIFIGFAQGLAITPGLSRSGLTIAASLFTGLNREDAARYSFILSIPVIAGAALLQLKDVLGAASAAQPVTIYLIGVIFSALFGYLAIRLLLNLLNRGKLRYFAYYCWFVGLAIILSQVF